MFVLVMDMPYEDFVAELKQLFFLFVFTICWSIWLVYQYRAHGPTYKRPVKQVNRTELLTYCIMNCLLIYNIIYTEKKRKAARRKCSKWCKEPTYRWSGTKGNADSSPPECRLEAPGYFNSVFVRDKILSLPDSPRSPSPAAPLENAAGNLKMRHLPRPPGAGLKQIRREAMTHHPVKFNIRKKLIEGLFGCPTP